ncbi:F0F1 ATP synthase subunit B [Candidatus Parcubacteria bacterium]|nr:F0F1 ATP synthase subunit B [Candidatus Parcubacteria bacterium]
MAVLNHILLAATEAAAENTAGGLGSIGLDWRALVFQLVNFALLFWLLKKVAYQPILGVLEDRRRRIEESEATARQIEETSRQTAARQAALLAEARREADAMLARSREEAAKLLAQAESRARTQTEQLLETAHQRVAQEVAEAKAGLRKELAGLVVAATAVLIDEKLDERKDAALVQKALQRAERS